MSLLQIAELVDTQRWPGLEIQNSIGSRGRGVVATDYFRKGDILLDYHGKQISLEEDAEIMANEDDNRSCYLFKVYFFPCNHVMYDFIV